MGRAVGLPSMRTLSHHRTSQAGKYPQTPALSCLRGDPRERHSLSNMSSTPDADPADLDVLRALAAGRLPGRHLLSSELRLLEVEGLISSSPEALPVLTPRGRLLLQVANGECAPPLD